MPEAKQQVTKETREERRLNFATAEALGYLFNAPDDYEEFEFADFRAEIEDAGVTVSLNLPGGGGATVSGADFANWVWELFANAR